MNMTSIITAAALASAGAQSVELTVYNQGFALVKESRTINLKAGVQSVAIEDVAQMIESTSVGIRSLSKPGSFSVLEQNYQYDLISPNAILNKAVGTRIIFNRVLPNGVRESVSGILISSPGNGGGLVIKTDDGRYLLNPQGDIEVSSIPEGLISKPTLLWMLDSEAAGPNNIELSYLTQGMTWNADYVLSLDQAGVAGDLKGWVTMNNNSGATFSNAKLKLLAGDVERAAARPELAKSAMMDSAGAGGRGFREEQFADYHLYTLQHPATVRQNEQKQLSLLDAYGVKVEKRLILDAMRGYYGYRASEGEIGTGAMKPQVRIELTNTKANNMGMPLPMGNFKVFQRDGSGSLQLLGEDRIEHTPKDEKISLFVGRAFDVIGERKRTAFEYIRRGTSTIGARESFEIELRNRKETSESVTVIERYWGDWKVTAASHPYERTSAETIQFLVKLKPNEVQKVTYTVENRW